jgi:uncharacterized membrane protein
MAAAALAEQDGLSMTAKYILAGVAALFFAAALLRLLRDGGRLVPASRTWFMISVIFSIVSMWLWHR